MAKNVVIDELHVTIRVPGDLPEDEAGSIRVTLMGKEFASRNGFRGRWITVETQPKRQKRRGFVASNRGSDGG